MPTINKRKTLLYGGPLDGYFLYMSGRDTLVFRLGEWHGYYDHGVWASV